MDENVDDLPEGPAPQVATGSRRRLPWLIVAAALVLAAGAATATTTVRRRSRSTASIRETQQEAYERFKVLFADQPELVKLVRPESLPASVTLLPTDGVYPGDLANAITDELSTIESVGAGCEFPE